MKGTNIPCDMIFAESQKRKENISMKTKTHMTRTLSFLLALTLCIPMLLAFAAPASAATSQISFGIGTSACQGNLSSYSLPAHNSKVYVGRKIYINVAATSDIMLKTIEAYVSNGGNYALVGRETARNYLRWSAFEYTPTTQGSLTFLVKVYYTNGRTAQGKVTVTVEEKSTSSGNSMIWNGIRYTVVPNAIVSLYRYNQKNYPRFVNGSGRNVGCTATAMATAYSILHNTLKSPENVQWSSSGCSWELAKRLTDNGFSYSPYTYSTQEALQAVFRSVNRGVPVIVGVTGAGMDHVVTAIGFREGANPSNLSLSDILIIDPNGGQVCSLAKYSGVDTGWSLRVPI